MKKKHLLKTVLSFVLLLSLIIGNVSYVVTAEPEESTVLESDELSSSESETVEKTRSEETLKETVPASTPEESEPAEESIPQEESVSSETEEEIPEESEETEVPSSSVTSTPLQDGTQSLPYFDIYWLDDHRTSENVYGSTSASGHATSVNSTPSRDSSSSNTTSSGNSVKAQVEFSSGVTEGNPMEAGDVQIILPRYFYQEWDWDDEGEKEAPIHTASPILGIGQKSNKTGKGFWFYYASKDPDTGEWVESSSGDHIIIENYETLSDVTTFTCEIQYPYSPSSVDSTKTHVLEAEFHAYDSTGSEKEKKVDNSRLTAKVNTSSNLVSVTKKLLSSSSGSTTSYSEWQESWGEFPEFLDETKEYVYIPWEIRVKVSRDPGTESILATQPFYLYISNEQPGVNGVTAPNGATVNGNGQGQIVAIENYAAIYDTVYHNFHTPEWYKEQVNYFDGQPTYHFSDYSAAGGDGKYLLGNIYGGSSSLGNTVGSYSYFDTGYTNFRTGVVIAYPKDYIETMRQAGSDTTDYLTNKIQVTKVPYDGSPKQTVEATVADRYQRVQFQYDPGIWGIHKYHVGSGNVSSQGVLDPDEHGYTSRGAETSKIMGGSWNLQNDSYVRLYEYSISTHNGSSDGYISPGGLTLLNPKKDSSGKYVIENIDDFGAVPYYMEIMDDILIFNGEQLEPGDYSLVSSIYTSSERVPDPDNDYQPVQVPADQKAKPDLYVRYETNGEWILYGTEMDDTRTTYTPDDQGNYPVGFKYVWASKAMDISTRVSFVFRLNPTEHVKSLLHQAGASVYDDQVTNIASFVIKDHNGQIITYGDDSILQTGYMQDIVKAHDKADGLDEGKYYIHDRTYQYLDNIDMNTTFTKSSSSSSSANTQTSSASYTLRSSQTLAFYTDDATKLLENLDNSGVVYGQKEITFYDLLPEGATLSVSSLAARYSSGNTTLSPSVDGTIKSYTTVDNYKGSGQTLLIVKVAFPEGLDSEWGKKWDSATGRLDLSTNVTLSFTCNYDWNDLAFYFESGESIYNQGAVEVPYSGDGIRDNVVDNSARTSNGVRGEYADCMTNLHEADGGSTVGADMYFDYTSHAFNFVTSSLTGYSKLVKAESESSYRNNSAVQPSESYSYRLRYASESDTKAKNIKMFDVLEYAFVEDAYMDAENHQEKYDKAGQRYWLGTFDHVNVTAAEKLGINVKVYYSTFDREEMQLGLNTLTSNYSNNPYADLSNTAYWKGPYTAAQINALSDSVKSSITAISFDCSKDRSGNDFVLDYSADGTKVIMLYIFMNGPDKEEIETGHDGKGSYVFPEHVYAFNNSFLSASSAPSTGSAWSNPAARMSNGTTVRTYEPHPPIYKAEEKQDGTTAGCFDETDDPENNSVSFEDKNEVIKYTISTKVPILGTDTSGEDEHNTFTVYDNLVSEMEFNSVTNVRIQIGNEDGDNYFLYDPETKSGTLKVNGGTPETFSGLEELPFGFSLAVDNITYTKTSSFFGGSNSLYFVLGYNEKEREDTDGNIIPVYDRVNDFAGEPLTITFYANIRPGVSLAAYSDGKIPNTAHYRIPNHLGNDSNTVYLDVPKEDPKIPYKTLRLVDGDGNSVDEEAQEFYVVNKEDNSKVNDANGNPIRVVVSYDKEGNRILKDRNGNDYTLEEGQDIRTEQTMNNMSQTIEYKINGIIPENATSFMMADRVVSALQIDPESVKVRISGDAQVIPYIKTENYYIKTDNDEKGVKEGDYVTEKPDWGEEGTDWYLAFTDYKKEYSEDDGTIERKTLSVDRTFDAEELSRISSYQGFTLATEERSVSLEITNIFINSYGDYYVGGQSEERERTVTDKETGEEKTEKYKVFIAGEYGSTSSNGPTDFALAGLNIEIIFNATIREGADLTNYATEEGISIPNTANYRFGSTAEENTNTVWVEIPEVDKKVNGRTEVTLAAMDEIFTYRIGAIIPSVNADLEEPEEGEEPPAPLVLEKAQLTDTLDDILEFVDTEDVVFLIDGEEQDTSVITFDGQTITVDLMKAAEEHPAKYAYVEFKARIKDGVTYEELAPYINKVSEPEIPNEAVLRVKIENSPETEHSSKPVYVTPPPIEKKVNEKYHEDLSTKDEVFTYTIRTWMPETDKLNDEKATVFKVIDTLEDVLEFVNEDTIAVTVDGAEVDADIQIDGQTLTVTFSEEQIEVSPRKAVTVAFDAKIKDGADISPYRDDRGKAMVPNKSSYKINNDNEVESNMVTVTPPSDPPVIEKTVNKEKHADLDTFSQVFTYDITTTIPEDAVTFTVYDTLEKVLEFSGDVKVTVKGKELSKDTADISGQTVTIALDEKTVSENRGEKITISFKAKIKDNADISPYKDDKGKVLIPNTARYSYKNLSDQEYKMPSNKVTVTPGKGSGTKTGDDFNPGLLSVTLLLSAAMLIALLGINKRKNKNI